jgi:hypothetical protein
LKSRSDVTSRPLLAFGCLASVSPPSLGAGWASEPERRRAPLLPFSMLAARRGTGHREWHGRALLLLHYSMVHSRDRTLQWQVSDGSYICPNG